ncbi:MAG: phosphotransferase [Planctomycetes bacterium]|nr:phosphotransferase [Planctomycetota bacterium]MCP4859981.1 phosphotransferase [Planctomycetota bacterium]
MTETDSTLSPADAALALLGEGCALQALTPEVSPRRYFRVASVASDVDVDVAGVTGAGESTSWLVVLSPTPAPQATTGFLADLDIRVPQIGKVIDGAYLVEDLGDRHLVHEPTAVNYQELLKQWRVLSTAQLPAAHPNLALALDHKLFDFELGMFRDCYLLDYRALSLSAAELGAVNDAIKELAQLASAGPLCLQHRDFHSRNILLPEHGDGAWIDHQDLRIGPLFYDLASLYTDAYADLPDDVYALLRDQVAPLGASFGLDPGAAEERFLLTALQRILKALGTFGKVLANGRNDFQPAETQARLLALALLDQLAIYPELRKLISQT